MGPVPSPARHSIAGPVPSAGDCDGHRCSLRPEGSTMTEVLPETPHPADGHQTPNVLASPPQSMVPGVAPALATTHPSIHPGSHAAAPSPAHRGREKLHWGKEIWDRLDHAVHKELERTRVAA